MRSRRYGARCHYIGWQMMERMDTPAEFCLIAISGSPRCPRVTILINFDDPWDWEGHVNLMFRLAKYWAKQFHFQPVLIPLVSIYFLALDFALHRILPFSLKLGACLDTNLYLKSETSRLCRFRESLDSAAAAWVSIFHRLKDSLWLGLWAPWERGLYPFSALFCFA